MDKIKLFISEDEIKARVAELGKILSEEYRDKELVVVGVLKGAVVFMTDLIRNIDLPNIYLDFLEASSYGDSTESSGTVELKRDLSVDVSGKHVLVVEDIIDTGRTLKAIKEHITDKGASSVKLCALIDKPSRRVVDIDADFVGIDIPDKFIVGYGLDYAQKYRHLPYIGEIVQ